MDHFNLLAGVQPLGRNGRESGSDEFFLFFSWGGGREEKM